MRQLVFIALLILAPVLCFADPIMEPSCDDVCRELPCHVDDCVARCNAIDAVGRCFNMWTGTCDQECLGCICSALGAPIDDDNTPGDDDDNDSAGDDNDNDNDNDNDSGGDDDASPANHGGSSHHRSGCGVVAGNINLLMFLFMTGIGFAALALGRRGNHKR